LADLLADAGLAGRRRKGRDLRLTPGQLEDELPLAEEAAEDGFLEAAGVPGHLRL
jgi:hypothetical protein